MFIAIACVRPGAAIRLLLVGMATWVMLLQSQSRARLLDMRKRAYREQRRQRAYEKTKRNLQAQLNKRDFETRLNSYVTPENAEQPGEFVSKMKYWQLNECHRRTPTRPVELLRTLLQRIAKLVGRS